jgi:hypothetical protein
VNSDAGSAVISWTSTPIITGVQATPLNASVAVSWDASDLGSLSGYRVYGGTTAAPTTLLATQLIMADLTEHSTPTMKQLSMVE